MESGIYIRVGTKNILLEDLTEEQIKAYTAEFQIENDLEQGDELENE